MNKYCTNAYIDDLLMLQIMSWPDKNAYRLSETGDAEQTPVCFDILLEVRATRNIRKE